MGVENFTAAPGAGTRRAKRARVLLAAKLQTPYGEIDARLRDLSQKGALVECSPTPPQGSEVVFSRGPITVPARVAWSGEGRVGLEFHYRIDENEMLVQLKRVSNLQARERFRRPGIKESASEKERALAAAWGVQVGINISDGDF
ncbi:PilZ domain-containing protein [Sphingosinicella sp. YJ22]|uniref:PilZ domain-containing protein n=1 Tax=Sphingosinicella sp. YJ22 TaxID=1104780 RepID=UPI00140724BE|nr:PilZ domain-containing protein [Sphingosinicella sp. YJ22]